MDKLIVSSSPHVKSEETVPRIMWTVFIALLPAAAAGVYYFGIKALLVLVLATTSAVGAEALVFVILKKDWKKCLDGSAAVTGLLLAMVISSNVKWYVAVVGSLTAIIIVKHLFGGLGCNIWNPALLGRAFVLAAYASQMAGGWAAVGPTTVAEMNAATTNKVVTNGDARTGATPLEVISKGLWDDKDPKKAIPVPALLDTWTGRIGGSIGETCAILLMLGGLFLIWRGYVNWRVPLFFVLTVVAMSTILPYKGGVKLPDGWNMLHYMIFTAGAGGLMLGAFFMATDMVTSPVTNKGLIIFAVGCGVLTAVIRLYGGYPEGVCYSILLMNTATPLIDRFTQPKTFGAKTNA